MMAETVLRTAAFVVAALAVSGGAASAQSMSSGTAGVAGFPLPFDQTPPADTGKPRFYIPPPVIPAPDGCAASFDCRVRIIGAIQHNGVVELNATMLKW